MSSNNFGKTPNTNQQVSGVDITSSCMGLENEQQNVLNSIDTNASKVNFIPDNTAVIPPHIETQEIPHGVQHPSSSIHYIFFPSNPPKSPPRTRNILVKDTPEREYGLKVTWRRRKNILKLLRERGQLLVNDALISNQ